MNTLTVKQAFGDNNVDLLGDSLEKFNKKGIYDEKFWQKTLTLLHTKEEITNWRHLNFEALKGAAPNPVKRISFD